MTQTVCLVTFFQIPDSHVLPRGRSTWLMISRANDSSLVGTTQVELHAHLWGLLSCQPPAHLWELGRASLLCSFLGGTGEVELPMPERTAATSCPPEDSQVALGGSREVLRSTATWEVAGWWQMILVLHDCVSPSACGHCLGLLQAPWLPSVLVHL